MKKLLATSLLLASAITVCGQNAAKTITNADLNRFKNERVKNDPDDERERQRLGLPSPAEQERRRENEKLALNNIAVKFRREQAQKENYWQAQAYPIQVELFAVEAEINYLRARINEFNSTRNGYSIGYSPFFSELNYGYNQSIVANQIGIGGSFIFGNESRASIGIRRQTIESIGGGTNNSSYGNGFYGGRILVFNNYQNWTRQNLISRLYAIEQTRAGLIARFTVIEDAARRDGVNFR
jgi:hypothetical protein